MAFEIHTTGGGDQLTVTLNAVAAMTASSNYEYVLAIVLQVSVIFIALAVLMGKSIKDSVYTYLSVAVISALSLGHTSDVIIFDKTRGPLWSSTVSNVPTSLAVMGSVTSTISHKLTQQMETLYSPPTNLAYSKTGLLFGATLMAKSARWRAVTTEVHENLVNYMDQCVLDAISLRYVQPEAYLRAGDLSAAMTTHVPSSLAYYDVNTKTTRLCSDGLPDILTATANDVANVLAIQAASIFQLPPDVLGVNGAAAVATLQSAMSDFAGFAQMASTSAVDQTKQAMLIAALDDAATRGIAATSNAAALDHLQTARAEAQTRATYKAISANAASWVPYLKIVFENLYYGAFPMALAMIFTPLGLAVIRGYFGGFLWLASWEPLSAILHGIVLESSASNYRTVGSITSDGSLSGAVISWANHFGVYGVQQDVAALAGFFMTLIPFASLGIIFGVNRFANLATSSLAVGQGAAGEAASEAVSGNITRGNSSVQNHSARNLSTDNYTRNVRSYDNTTGNQHVTAPLYDNLGYSVRQPNGGVIHYNHDGTIGMDAGKSAVKTNASMGLSQSILGAARTAETTLWERGDDYRRAATQGVSDMATQTSAFMQAIDDRQIYARAGGTNQSSEQRESAVRASSALKQFADENRIERRTAMSLAAIGSVRGGIDRLKFVDLGWELRGELQRSGINSDNFSQLQQSAENLSVDESFATLQSQFHSLTSTQQDSMSNMLDYSNRVSVDDIRRWENSASVYERGAEAWNTATEQTRSRLARGDLDLTPAFNEFLINEKGYAPTQVNQLLDVRGDDVGQLMDLQNEFSERWVSEQFVPKMSDKLGTALPDPFLKNTIAPLGLPYNHVHAPGSHSEIAAAALEVDTAILRAQGLGEDERGAIALEVERGSQKVEGGVGAAAANSWASKAHGGLVDNGYVDQGGYYQAPNVSYDLAGKTRDLPVQPRLMHDMSDILGVIGPNIGMIVTSGGQPSHGPDREGGPRHDHGNAVDFVLSMDGRIVRPDEAPELYATVIEMAAARYTGIGHYDWGLHVGGGSPAFWGHDKTSDSADPYFKQAYERGREVANTDKRGRRPAS